MTDGAAPRPRRISWRRLAGWAVSAVILAAVVVALQERIAATRDAGSLPGAVPVAVAVAANAAANGVLVVAWRRVLLTAGSPLPLRPAVWVWAVSQASRYTVGAAQVGGRALAGRRFGLSAVAGAASTLVEVAWQTSLSALLALATAPWWLPATAALRWLTVLAAVPAAALLAGLVVPRVLLRAVARILATRPLAWLGKGRLASGVDAVDLSRLDALQLTALYAANTAVRLTAFLVLLAAVTPGPHPTLAAVGAYAVGQLVGRLAVFAPGGLGPREGATAIVLTPLIGAAPALVLVAAVRLAELLGEALFFLAALALRPDRA